MERSLFSQEKRSWGCHKEASSIGERNALLFETLGVLVAYGRLYLFRKIVACSEQW
jgi:hypothetical protein